MSVANVSGAVFNPAVIIGLNTAKQFWRIAYLLWVILANFAGSVLGALMYFLIDPDLKLGRFGRRTPAVESGEQQSLLAD